MRFNEQKNGYDYETIEPKVTTDAEYQALLVRSKPMFERIKRLNNQLCEPDAPFATDKIDVCRHCPFSESTLLHGFSGHTLLHGRYIGDVENNIRFGVCQMTPSDDWYHNPIGLHPAFLAAGFKPPAECPMLPEFLKDQNP